MQARESVVSLRLAKMQDEVLRFETSSSKIDAFQRALS